MFWFPLPEKMHQEWLQITLKFKDNFVSGASIHGRRKTSEVNTRVTSEHVTATKEKHLQHLQFLLFYLGRMLDLCCCFLVNVSFSWFSLECDEPWSMGKIPLESCVQRKRNTKCQRRTIVSTSNRVIFHGTNMSHPSKENHLPNPDWSPEWLAADSQENLSTSKVDGTIPYDSQVFLYHSPLSSPWGRWSAHRF